MSWYDNIFLGAPDDEPEPQMEIGTYEIYHNDIDYDVTVDLIGHVYPRHFHNGWPYINDMGILLAYFSSLVNELWRHYDHRIMCTTFAIGINFEQSKRRIGGLCPSKRIIAFEIFQRTGSKNNI